MNNTLEERIGYHFKNRALSLTALTHSSFANESRKDGDGSYERLEFLGDSVLGMVTAELLYAREPALPEGQMTRLRADLVCENALHRVAVALGLGDFLRLGHGAELTGDRLRPSILADTVESLIAAIYLDGGMEEARRFITGFVLDQDLLSRSLPSSDFKSSLQEYAQRNGVASILYEQIAESGPDHDKTFVFSVSVDGEAAGEGSGKTKKEAEQEAARHALEKLRG